MHRLLVPLAAVLAASTAFAAPAPVASRHMIAAAEPDAAAAGLEMLRQGGSAVDAAIAAQMVLTLEEPQSSGIGGGAYIIVSEANGALAAYDGRETAPASASPSMFLDANGNPRPFDQVRPGGLSVGIPGDVRVLALAHAQHGKIPWPRLFEPAIRLAEQGYKVSPRLAQQLAQGGAQLAAMPGMRALFYHSDGTPVKAGETWKNPELGQTFRTIAANGADAFYTGPIAAAISDAVTHAPKNATVMTREDIAGYQP